MKKIVIFVLLMFPSVVLGLDTSAECAIMMDINSERILYAKNIHKKRPVASISKIMTAVVALESGKKDDIVTIGNEIEDAYGSGIYIKQNEHMKLEDLIYGLMLRSGNDASLAIAKHVGGSVEKFVSLMNAKAKELRMSNTVYNNPNGLDDNGGNISTAYDMAILTSYAMKNSDYSRIVGTKSYRLKTDMNYYSWTNKNRLLYNYKYTTGGKTGFTDVAKRTLVTTARYNNLDVVVVTLNDGDDFRDHEQLYKYVYDNYKNYYILRKGQIDVINEYYKDSYMYIKNDFVYPLNDIEKGNIIAKFELYNQHVEQDKIGKVFIYLGDNKLFEDDVYIEKRIQKNFFEKFWDWIKGL